MTLHRCPLCRSKTLRSPWNDLAGGLPDDAITVLAALDDGEVWPCYVSEGEWRYVTDEPIQSATVIYWMDLPPHPDAKEED